MVTFNAVVYQKDGETYVWTFREGEEQTALNAICETANRDDLALDWDDANFIWQRMGREPDVLEARDVATLFSVRPRT